MHSPAKYFWIYILECENGAFYTGYTNNLVRRFRQHVDGTAGVKYTRSHRPTRLAQCWRLYGGVGDALKVEALIKKRGRSAKEHLIRAPERLADMVGAIVTARLAGFDPAAVERAARALETTEVKTAPDPFAGSG